MSTRSVRNLNMTLSLIRSFIFPEANGAHYRHNRIFHETSTPRIFLQKGGGREWRNLWLSLENKLEPALFAHRRWCLTVGAQITTLKLRETTIFCAPNSMGRAFGQF